MHLLQKEIDKLLKHENCSDYILDLLWFIKHNLLRMNPDNRASCDNIVRKFKEFHENCITSDDYCVKKLKSLPNRSTTDSSLLVGDGFSPEQMRTLQNHVVQLTRVTEHITMQSVSSLQPYDDSQSGSRPQSVFRGSSFSQGLLPLLNENQDSRFIESVGTRSQQMTRQSGDGLTKKDLDKLEEDVAINHCSSEMSRSTERTTKPGTLSVPDGTDDGVSIWTGNTFGTDHDRNRLDDGKLPPGTKYEDMQQGDRQRGRLRHGFSRIWGKLRSISRINV